MECFLAWIFLTQWVRKILLENQKNFLVKWAFSNHYTFLSFTDSGFCKVLCFHFFAHAFGLVFLILSRHYIILDNAAYQKCEKVKLKAQELNINLIYLPPYSPNLNLIERLWKFLRKNVLAGNYYESFELFNSSIKAFIDTLHIEYTDRLSSLLSFNFELLDSVAWGEVEIAASIITWFMLMLMSLAHTA